MNGAWSLLGAAALGLLAGLAFFASLRATIGRLSQSNRPIALLMGSAVLRFGLALTVFYIVSRYGDWRHLLVAVAAFSAARLWVVRKATQDRSPA